ncbi:MAG TPA: alpha/beta hydrolase [Candidatus Krumholzibacteria bacterium]|nr:alpha/beta hydrolase [Candidatus Krumholzibacteria bacterium]HRX52780.1 alpha/beta hydrolase [Candidatus Krumholzibacteria bacterium]
MFLRRCLLAAAVVLGTAAAVVAQPTARFIEREPNLWLETLDWGGQGPDVLLLAGLNHTAHMWEDFAPRLLSRARVTAFTRRGWGASSHAAQGYTPGELAADVLAVCDSLGLDRPVLVGCSVAGAEMALAASRRPGGFRGFVFLDAAYDHSLIAEISERAAPPRLPRPTREELASPQGVGEYFRRTRGYALPEAEVLALHAFTPTGHLKDRNASPLAESLIVAGMQPPPFQALDAPVLAIYAKPTVASLFPDRSAFTAADLAAARTRVDLLREMLAAQVAAFEAVVPQAWIQVWDGANLNLPLAHPYKVGVVLRPFLDSLPVEPVAADSLGVDAVR